MAEYVGSRWWRPQFTPGDWFDLEQMEFERGEPAVYGGSGQQGWQGAGYNGVTLPVAYEPSRDTDRTTFTTHGPNWSSWAKVWSRINDTMKKNPNQDPIPVAMREIQRLKADFDREGKDWATSGFGPIEAGNPNAPAPGGAAGAGAASPAGLLPKGPVEAPPSTVPAAAVGPPESPFGLPGGEVPGAAPPVAAPAPLDPNLPQAELAQYLATLGDGAFGQHMLREYARRGKALFGGEGG